MLRNYLETNLCCPGPPPTLSPFFVSDGEINEIKTRIKDWAAAHDCLDEYEKGDFGFMFKVRIQCKIFSLGGLPLSRMQRTDYVLLLCREGRSKEVVVQSFPGVVVQPFWKSRRTLELVTQSRFMLGFQGT